MTATVKSSGFPHRGSTFRALAALTHDDEGRPGLPVPMGTAMKNAALYLDFDAFDDAAGWASRLDLTAHRINQIPVPDTGIAVSQWRGMWRGWMVYLTATVEPDTRGQAVTDGLVDEPAVRVALGMASGPGSISQERVEAIVAELNRRTQQTCSDEADVPWWDWIADQPEFDREATAAAVDTSGIHLVDGTVLVWHSAPQAWKRAAAAAGDAR